MEEIKMKDEKKARITENAIMLIGIVVACYILVL